MEEYGKGKVEERKRREMNVIERTGNKRRGIGREIEEEGLVKEEEELEKGRKVDKER